jgi:hypothetical protein
MDLALHPTRLPTSLEKWYIDALLDDGTVLLVYLGVLTLVGVRLSRVTAELFPPRGPAVRGSAIVRHVPRGGEGVLRFGSASIIGNRLRFTTSGLSGDLVFRPRHPPCSLREPFLARGGRSLHWMVEIPDADVTGTLQWSGGARTVKGRGYRDRVWFDLVPWNFPIRQLVWGRAIAGTHAATWVHATTAQSSIASSWLDGQIVSNHSGSGPPSGVALQPGRVFLDADVVALDGLHLGWPLRPLIRRLSGDPHETKWQTACTIAGEDGMAVHEVVRWQA